MTKHSISELKRQVERAIFIKRKALQDELKALNDSLGERMLNEIRAKGVVVDETPLRIFRRRYGREEELPDGPHYITGTTLYYGDLRFLVRGTNRNGTRSKREIATPIDRFEIIE